MNPITPKASNLIWIDLEMTGLDPNIDRIIEMAAIVTDAQLNVIAEGPVFAIHQEDKLLEEMDEWNTTHHTASGLIERVRASNIDEMTAQGEMLEFLMYHVPYGKSPMCGNSVHQDRRFLLAYMPKLHNYFHYRNLDVSTVKTLAYNWAPKVASGFKKETAHEALSDIRDSIEEMRYYKENFFRIEQQ